MSKERVPTSKKILWATYVLFVFQIVLPMVCIFMSYDTSIFIYSIPATGALAGATTVFYMNKSKMENVFKFKISFLKYKMNLINEHPEQSEAINDALLPVEEALDTKIDQELQDAVNEDISIQNY